MKRSLIERALSDFLPDEFKKKSKESALERVREKGASSSKFVNSMFTAPQLEGADKQKLVSLAKKALFRIYPDLKEAVKGGHVIIDADLSGGSGGRTTPQKISPSEVERVSTKYPQFAELKKKREYTNAMTQGKSWDTGFNYIYALRDELENINPELYDTYVDFIEGASEYYFNNTEQLERMASQTSGRVAYVDVSRDEDGTVRIEARAPLFPLLLHELVKGAEYFRSSHSLPKEKELRQTLLKTTDTHKGEIQSMNYGRFIVRKMREFLGDNVSEYQPSMEVNIVNELESLPEREFNELMDGFLNNEQAAYNKLKRLAEDVIKDL
jgi:hypothetical protein